MVWFLVGHLGYGAPSRVSCSDGTVLDDVVELLIGYLVLMILYDVVCSGPEVEEAALDDGYRNRKNYFFVKKPT